MQKTQKSPKSMTGHALSQLEITSLLLRNLNKFELTPVTKLVLLELTTHLNAEKNGSVVFPSTNYIAEVLGIGLTACKKAINDLIAAGIIIKTKRDKVKGNYNKYLLRLAKIDFNEGKNDNRCSYPQKDINGQKTTEKSSENEFLKQSESDRFMITNNHEQKTQQRVVKIFPEKKQEIDKYLLKHVQGLQGIKNDEKFARWLMRTGQAEQIISDMKQAETNSKAMLKKTENLIKQQKEDAENASAEMPQFFKDFGERLKSYCKQ